ncbi:MAG: DUF5131 family protein [Hyphomicrobiales bacterium]|nr:DUF5131 family protein [Hyphomicrobiales bacterium]
MRAGVMSGAAPDGAAAGASPAAVTVPPMPDWARAIRDQCADAGVAFFMKQMARKAPIPPDLMVREFPRAPTLPKAAPSLADDVERGAPAPAGREGADE